MKEIPILFSTPMVQAILAGRKTQTRRVVKPQPPKDYDYSGTDTDKSSGESVFYACWEGSNFHNVKCPYGQPGDVLWVRESFYEPLFEKLNGKYYYKADLEKQGWDFKWKPSIHMPKAAARIWLKVVNVRVERLQEITEQDAISEGVESIGFERRTNRAYRYKTYTDPTKETCWGAKDSFRTLWQSINGAESWDANPWVWVVEFEVLSTTGRPCSI